MATTFSSDLDIKKRDCFYIHPEELVMVTDKEHPLYDPRMDLPINSNTVETILEYGVCEPIICRKLDDGRVEVINGRQRTKAAREANRILKEKGGEPIRIPFVLRNEEEHRCAAIADVTNQHQIAETVWHRIVKFNRHIETYGRTVAEASVIMNVSVQTGHMYKKALTLPKKLQKMIAGEKISLPAAIELATDEDWEEKLEGLMETGKASVSRVKKAVATGDCQRHRSLPFKKLEMFLSEKETVLNPDVIKGIKFAMNLITEADL